MTTSLYKLSEQVRLLTSKGEPQEIIEHIKQALATAIKNEWYKGKAEGVAEVNGQFVYTFTKDANGNPLVPQLDSQTDLYYITIPSSYLNLPYNGGIESVSYTKSANDPFVPYGTVSSGLFDGLESDIMGGRQVYFVEDTNMYFPKMSVTRLGTIMLKLAVALDLKDPDQDLNISPDIADAVVSMVASKINPEPKEDKLFSH
jgi:hypothetical protein